MADEEKEERVSTEDVLRVLAKHSPVPNDPDDAGLIGRYNAQQAEDQQPDDTADSRTGQKGEEGDDESPQGGSQPKGSPTARTPSTSSSGARKEKP